MPAVDRRGFIATSAFALSAASYRSAAAEPGERVRLAVMGLRSRGKDLLGGFTGLPHVEVTHLIDPDPGVIKPALDIVKSQQTRPKVETDVRKALDDPSVTALVVAAPDHWHALATVWACQAGKHVYVEKPCSHNVVEGRRMIEAARKHDRVVQVGTHRRSLPHIIAAREFVQSGKLGKVPFARASIAGHRPSIGRKPDGSPPPGVDYALWQGPAPERPFNPNRFHYNWHWFWDLGTGEIGNNGIHGLDVIRYVLGLDAPTRVTSAGGKFYYDDDQQTPDTQVATFDFPTCTVAWEHRIWAKAGLDGESFGISLHGEKGTMVFDSKGWHVKDGVEAEMNGSVITPPHLENFLACVRTGGRPNADVAEGHASTRLCHLGNIAFRTGRALQFDTATETFRNDPEANALLGREYRKGFELPKV
jgi:predicted dehydrogenase